MGVRSIKFRGKRIDNDEWVEGNLIEAERNGINRYFIGGNKYFFENSIKYVDMYEVHCVGQYTGLKDKNEKESFDGDLVDFNGNKGGVYWSDYAYGWRIRFEEQPEEKVRMEDCEIIGTIHDKELKD